MTNTLDGMLDTLGNKEWLKKNEVSLKSILPENWTRMENMEVLPIAYKLKLLGVPWKSYDDFGWVMVMLVNLKILLRDGLLFKRNPNNVWS